MCVTLCAMPTPRTVTYEYPSAPDAVARLLSDPEFLRRRSEEAGEANVEVAIEDAGDGLRVVVARDKQVNLPAFARKMFSNLNRVVDSVTWRRQGEEWVSEYAIRIGGIPGEIQGRSTLMPLSSGCRHESSFEVTARVPVFASKLEAFVADLVERSFREYADRNAEWLQRSPESAA